MAATGEQHGALAADAVPVAVAVPSDGGGGDPTASVATMAPNPVVFFDIAPVYITPFARL